MEVRPREFQLIHALDHFLKGIAGFGGNGVRVYCNKFDFVGKFFGALAGDFIGAVNVWAVITGDEDNEVFSI